MFHLLASPEEIKEQIPEILRLRASYGIKERPYIVWEPFPAVCKAANRQSHLEAWELVDVFSPNHLEMAALFETELDENFRPEQLEKYAAEFLVQQEQGAVVIRAGKHGSLTMDKLIKPLWLPSFYGNNSRQVVDPTGAGNTFLGGFMTGWDCFHDLRKASIYGNVAASFALEQIGLPVLEADGDHEVWNGDQVIHRLQDYESRLDMG